MERKDGPSPKETANSVGYVVGFVFGMAFWMRFGVVFGMILEAFWHENALKW